MRKQAIKYARDGVSVLRDRGGVPHVVAGSWREALYGLGYMHAVDRPTQLLFARVVAAGRAAERIADKPELVETDRFFRRAGLYLHLDREARRFDQDTLGDVTAYCDGVNDGLRQAGRSLPMWATGFRPQPWDPQAVLLIGNMLSYAGLSIGQQQGERLLLELIQLGIEDAKLRELFAPHLDEVDFTLLRRIKLSGQLSDEALELISDLPRLVGSNAWAVAPARSATGAALLASDPHLEINRLPAIWYEAVLRFGDQYAMGATLPGCPLMAVGRTERHAWGVTYMKGDMVDYFIEDCRPIVPGGGATGWQYRRGQKWQDFVLREERIARKGASTDVMRIFENPQGTLECDPDDVRPHHSGPFHTGGRMGQTPTTQTPGDPPRRGAKQRGGDDGDDKHDLGHNHPGAVSHHANGKPAAVHGEPGYYLSTAWAGHGEGSGRAISVWLEVAKAGSALEAMDAARESPQPSLCWIVADRQGHIGMQASGWFPRRRAGNGGQVPVPAWNAKNHWQGWIDSRALPRVYDPPEGFVATANENINQPQGPQLVTLPVPDYRKRRIVERLLELPAATVRDMQELQYDVHSVQARELLEEFVPYLPDGPVKRRLAAWDCRYAPASREATLFAALYRNVLLEVFGHEEGIGWRRMLYLCSRFGYSTMVLSAADRVLVRSDSSWWRGRDKGELVRRAAQRLAHERDRTWAKTNAFHFSNRFFDLRVGRMLGLRTREMAMPGCHATPFQGHLLRTATREATFAPAYHFVADLGTDEAWSNLPGGPSESRFSRYYKSGISLWRRGRYRRLAPTAGRRR